MSDPQSSSAAAGVDPASGAAPAALGDDIDRTVSPAPSDLDADEAAAAAASASSASGAASPYVLDTATGAVSVAAPPVPDAAALAAADAAWAAKGDPFADPDAADFCPLPRFTPDAEDGYIDLTNERMDDVGDLSHCADGCTELTLRCNVVRNVNLHRFACLTNLTLLDLYENRLTPLAFPANAKAPNALAWTPGMPPRVYGADAELPQVKAALERIRAGESATPVGKPFLTLTELKELDLSFNELRFTDNLEGPRALENLYLIENKVMAIGDLSHFGASLKLLELGSNRIRVMQNLAPLVQLEQLYLGRNKISRIEGISALKQLRVLHLQANRLVEIGDGILELENIEELYLSHNAISEMDGFQHLKKLKILDLAGNRIAQIKNLEGLDQLEDLWMNNNRLPDLSCLPLLRSLPALTTVYLEQNPCAAPSTYRPQVVAALPQLTQLDADAVIR